MSQPFAGVYDGKQVLLTGDTGFKGSWLALWLTRLGASVTGFALDPPSQPSLYEECGLASHIRSIRGDITDRDGVLAAVRDIRPDVVFHLAAQPIVLAAYDDPVTTFAANVMGTANVLDAVRHVGTVRSTVIVTTDKCYETNPASPPHRETDRLGGADPYSASKACAELVARSFRDSYDLPAAGSGIATTRAGNIIGGGDWAANRILPDCARAVATGQHLVLRHPGAIRPWQHVLDAIAGYLLLGARLLERPVLYSDAWNFGPDPSRPYTVSEAVDRFDAACRERDRSHGHDERGLTIDLAGRGTPFEQPTLRLDTEKARTRLGWEPVLDFGAAVDWTADWYWRRHFDPTFDTRTATLDQIGAYERAAAQTGVAWATPPDGVRIPAFGDQHAWKREETA